MHLILLCLLSFADDTNLFFKHHDLNTLFKNINFELSKIAVWFKINKLSLNIKKTNYILFLSGNEKVDNLGLEILIDNGKVNQVDHTKFLGVVINSRLNWKDHIKTVCCKVSKSTGILHRSRKNLNTDTLLLLYQTLIQPYFDYCNMIRSVGESVLLESYL